MLKHRAIYMQNIDPKLKATLARNGVVRDMEILLQTIG
jgi:hypothetical protein